MHSARVSAVAEAFAALGLDHIAAFDRAEPEFEMFSELRVQQKQLGVSLAETIQHRIALGMGAALINYRLAGDAQSFWSSLSTAVQDHGAVTSVPDVEAVLDVFLEDPVNSRSVSYKRTRVERFFESGFAEWLVSEYPNVEAVTVWEELAAALDNDMDLKTIVFAMKVFDVIEFIEHGEYLSVPSRVPIPVDLQTERMALLSGIVGESPTAEDVIEAWGAVTEGVSMRLDREVSVFRIDSIAWQAGQIVGQNKESRSVAENALTRHFTGVGVGESEAGRLAGELVTDFDRVRDLDVF
ncbi:N-glycosylase/DNA lyase [Halovenus sp. HT40]|uniref:N-glycosylase/DNA lyase n=1 Tax=Halovenus sp. HT40 TaxID=3126691 RepID=UPI00300F4E63